MTDAPGAPKRTLILIRTHFVDDRVAEMARRLGASGEYDVMIAADETAGPIDAREFPKLSMTLNSCVRLGLNVAFRKPLWRCGDYVFYHALALNRGYKLFWSIEYDTVLNFADPVDFFRLLDRRAGEDYLTTFLTVAEPTWYWSNAALSRFGLVYSSGFTLVRLNASAIAKLLERRSFEAKQLVEDQLDAAKYWLNDEAFVSSAAPELGLKMADLNKYGDFYTPQTLKRDGVWNPARLPPADGKIYHPVRTGVPFLHATTSYYDLELEEFFTWADAGLPEFGEAATRLLTARLANIPDDPAAVFGPDGALAQVAVHFQDSRVAATLLRALARRRLRLCIEAVQFGRIATKIARTPAFENHALGRLAWQSSVSAHSREHNLWLDAEGGNDGDTNGQGIDTGFQDAPWWAVDLNAVYHVQLVRLFNQELSEHRLHAFIVEASLDFVTWTVVYNHDKGDPEILDPRLIEIAVEPPTSARYVRVRLAHRGVLHLAEIEVIAG